MFDHSCPSPPRDQWNRWDLSYDSDNDEWDMTIENEWLAGITFCPFCGLKLPKSNLLEMETKTNEVV